MSAKTKLCSFSPDRRTPTKPHPPTDSERYPGGESSNCIRPPTRTKAKGDSSVQLVRLPMTAKRRGMVTRQTRVRSLVLILADVFPGGRVCQLQKKLKENLGSKGWQAENVPAVSVANIRKDFRGIPDLFRRFNFWTRREPLRTRTPGCTGVLVYWEVWMDLTVSSAVRL